MTKRSNKWVLALALMFAAPVALLAQVAPTPAPGQRTVSVSGEGLFRIAPDMATLRFGVVTIAPTAPEARQQNATAAGEAMEAVRALGIDEEDIQLESLHLQPHREYNPETQLWEENGYEAVRGVVVRVEDLDLLPELVMVVVDEGANRLNGIEYDLQDRDEARNQALTDAVRNAESKAQLLASTLDVNVGPVLHINEQSFDFPRPFYNAEVAMAAYDRAAATPVPEAYAAGEIEVRATVQVVFAIQ